MVLREELTTVSEFGGERAKNKIIVKVIMNAAVCRRN